MKRSTWLIMIFALFLVGSTTLVGQTSAAEKTIFTATDTFDPLNLLVLLCHKASSGPLLSAAPETSVSLKEGPAVVSQQGRDG
jgi:hypothetical protein